MKLGIIGTGKIVEDALFAIEPVSQIELKAIFAREHSRQKAEDFAARHKISEVYTDYDELLEKADIDTVYIGLINSVHYEYAKKALLKNKKLLGAGKIYKFSCFIISSCKRLFKNHILVF